MALMKYSEILTLAKDKIKEVMAPIRAHEMKKKAELELAKIEGYIAEKEQKIQEYASTYPIEYEKMIDAMDELGLIRRRKEQFEEIIAQLFN